MTFVYFWLVCGIINAIFSAWYDWYHGEYLDAITSLVYLLSTLAGPLILVVTLKEVLSDINWNIIFIKGRKK